MIGLNYKKHFILTKYTTEDKKCFLLIRNFVQQPNATLDSQQVYFSILLIYLLDGWNFTKPGKMPLFNACIPA